MKKLVTEKEIQQILKRLAKEINSDYKNKKPLIVGILKGSFMFMSDLIQQFKFDVEIDFIVTSSYKGTKTTGKVKILKDIKTDIKGKDVLIVDDIVDTGITLKNLMPMLKARNPKSIKVVTMLDKPKRRLVDFEPNYVGKKIEDHFVVGYGLDYNEKFRQLPYIAIYPSTSSSSRTLRDE